MSRGRIKLKNQDIPKALNAKLYGANISCNQIFKSNACIPVFDPFSNIKAIFQQFFRTSLLCCYQISLSKKSDFRFSFENVVHFMGNRIAKLPKSTIISIIMPHLAVQDSRNSTARYVRAAVAHSRLRIPFRTGD